MLFSTYFYTIIYIVFVSYTAATHHTYNMYTIIPNSQVISNITKAHCLRQSEGFLLLLMGRDRVVL